MAYHRDRPRGKILPIDKSGRRCNSKKNWPNGTGSLMRSGLSPGSPKERNMEKRRWGDILRMRFRSLLSRGQVERELDKELRFHFDQAN